MIPPPSLRHLPRGMVAPTVCSLLVLAGLVPMSVARAGDNNGLETFIDCHPGEESHSSTARFEFSSEGAVLPRFMCSLDGADYAECESPYVVENLSLDEHSLVVYVKDLKTYDKSPASWAWIVVDTTEPFDGCGTPDADAGTPELDAGSPELDAGSPDMDAGSSSTDAGSPGTDAGSHGGTDAGPKPGTDAGSSGGGTDAGVSLDAGTGGGSDAGGVPDPTPTDAGTSDAGTPVDVPGDGPPDGPSPGETLDYLGGGVGCTGAPAPGVLAGLMLVALALRRRKRR